MQKEVNQAAERLRQYKKTQSLAVYENDETGPIRDRSILANAYLQEHAEDDGEAMTFKWWQEFTGRPKRPVINLDDNRRLSFSDGCGLVLEITGDEIEFPEVKTRGQLRMLLKALGVGSE